MELVLVSKESLRWIEGYARLSEQAKNLPDTRLAHVADREADIVELMREAKNWANRWIGLFALNTIVPFLTVECFGKQ